MNHHRWTLEYEAQVRDAVKSGVVPSPRGFYGIPPATEDLYDLFVQFDRVCSERDEAVAALRRIDELARGATLDRERIAQVAASVRDWKSTTFAETIILAPGRTVDIRATCPALDARAVNFPAGEWEAARFTVSGCGPVTMTRVVEGGAIEPACGADPPAIVRPWPGRCTRPQGHDGDHHGTWGRGRTWPREGGGS